MSLHQRRVPALLLLAVPCSLILGGCQRDDSRRFIKCIQRATAGKAFCVTVAQPNYRTIMLVFAELGQPPAQLDYTLRTGWPDRAGWPLDKARQALYVETGRRPGNLYNAVVLCDLATRQRRCVYEVESGRGRLESLRLVHVAADDTAAIIGHHAYSESSLDKRETGEWLEALDLATGRVRRLTPAFEVEPRVWFEGVDSKHEHAFIGTERGTLAWPLGDTQSKLWTAPVRFATSYQGGDMVLDETGETCVEMSGVERNPNPGGGPWDPYLSYRVVVFHGARRLTVTERTGPGALALSPRADRLAWEERRLSGGDMQINVGRIDGAAYVTERVIRRPRSLRGLVWLDEGTLLAYDEEECMAINTATGAATRVLHLDQQGRLQVP